ncbi:protein of unknown function [Legionella fallonii LLAP-10]|uniref:Uncharacterized protein n=1 Tax=Legionella fallonii LLAP-10 TaxID=1212491 RepID=A0A098G588_9GAMM|nr:protein of unknown function [Legionella fallonii LLAP-10]
MAIKILHYLFYKNLNHYPIKNQSLSRNLLFQITCQCIEYHYGLTHIIPQMYVFLNTNYFALASMSTVFLLPKLFNVILLNHMIIINKDSI